MADLTSSLAAYHGSGWEPRTGTLAGDVSAGMLWGRAGLDSEYGQLTRAMITLPGDDWPTPADWNLIQYRTSVKFSLLTSELTILGQVLRALGIDVVLNKADSRPDRTPRYNSIFPRDQFFVTPEGAVTARMGSQVRAGEERAACLNLAAAGVPILATIRGDACFEGADALWVTPRLVAVGIGNRTNEAGAGQVRAILAAMNVDTVFIPMPRAVQHLLGMLQVVGPQHTIVRSSHVPALLLTVLRAAGMRVTSIDDTDEVTSGMAMNFVVTGPSEIVMAADCPHAREKLERSGVRVRAEVRCSELVKAAGGLACATGIIARSLASLWVFAG